MHIYIYTCIHIYIYICACISVSPLIVIYICMYIYSYMDIYEFLYTHVRICLCVFVCGYMYVTFDRHRMAPTDFPFHSTIEGGSLQDPRSPHPHTDPACTDEKFSNVSGIVSYFTKYSSELTSQDAPQESRPPPTTVTQCVLIEIFEK